MQLVASGSNFVPFGPLAQKPNDDPTVEVRTLGRRRVLRCPNAHVANSLRLIDARPTVEGVTWAEDEEVVEDHKGLLSLRMNADFVAQGSALHLLGELHVDHHTRTMEEFPEAPLIHGASLEMQGGMVILVGDKGAGKSTLTCAMGLSGATVLGDEHVVLDGQRAITRPRTMRIKSGSLQWLPDSLGREVMQYPMVEDWHGFRIFSVPPSIFGSPWRLSWLPVRAVVMLRSNHGGVSSMRTISADEATPLLFDNAILPSKGIARALGNLRMLLSSTTLLEMRVGGLERATTLLYEI